MKIRLSLPVYFLVGVYALLLIGIVAFCLGVQTGLQHRYGESKWLEILNVFGTWLSGFGTISAVAATLYLTNRQLTMNAESLRIHVTPLTRYSEKRFVSDGINIEIISDGKSNPIVNEAWLQLGNKVGTFTYALAYFKNRVFAYGESIEFRLDSSEPSLHIITHAIDRLQESSSECSGSITVHCLNKTFTKSLSSELIRALQQTSLKDLDADSKPTYPRTHF
jgi:hypothetical protein